MRLSRRFIERIKKTIEILEQASVDEIEISSLWGKSRIRIKKGVFQAPEIIPDRQPEEIPLSEEYEYIKSPLVGTFYRASDSEGSYVQEGDIVRQGQVVCVVEALKIVNLISSEVEGKVVEILAEDGDPIEYNQQLLKLQKLN